jgi:acetyltransferase-like isoleucine patch superfamily enzyme
MSNCYSLKYLKKIGVNLLGSNIKISKYARIYNPKNLTIHDNVRIDDFTILSGNGLINIGNYVHISSGVLMLSGTNIICSNYSNIASGVKLYGKTDDFSGNYMMGPCYPSIYTNVKKGDIILEPHVILGASSIVLPNITLKEGTAIASFSLVNKDTESWKLYGGIPINILKKREKNCLVYQNILENNINYNIHDYTK